MFLLGFKWRVGSRVRMLATLALVVTFCMSFSACASPAPVATKVPEATEAPEPTKAPEPTEAPELGELVPELLQVGWTMAQSPDRYEMGMMLQKDLEQYLGLKTEFRPLDTPSFPPMFESTTNWAADFVITGYTGRPWRADPHEILSNFISAEIKDGGKNRYAYSNPRYDELIDLQSRELDPEKRRELVWEAQELMVEDAVIVNIWAKDNVGVYNKDLFTGIVPMYGSGAMNFWCALEMEPLTDQRILRVATIVEFNHMNVLLSTLGELEKLQLLFDTLVRITPEGTVVEWAAESLEYQDPTTLRVKLRPGMKWHDGEPVTAEDVKFTFDYYVEKQQPRLTSVLGIIDSVEVVDDLTADFILTQPSANFQMTVLGQSFLIPKHVWENIEDPNEVNEITHPEIMIASGPFIYKHWRRGEELEMVANPDHFNPPKIDGVRHIMYGNHEAAFLGFETANADISEWLVLPDYAARAEELPHLEVVTVPDIYAAFIAFQTRRAPMSDINFRKAMVHMVRYDYISDVIYGGYAQPCNTIVTIGNRFWHNPNVANVYEFNPEKAKQILIDAGYGWDEEGRLRMPPQ